MSMFATMTFKDLISNYVKIQSNVFSLVKTIASHMSNVQPGKFILVQMEMAKVTQMGDSISNLLAQVNSMISTAVRNQKTS